MCVCLCDTLVNNSIHNFAKYTLIKSSKYCEYQTIYGQMSTDTHSRTRKRESERKTKIGSTLERTKSKQNHGRKSKPQMNLMNIKTIENIFYVYSIETPWTKNTFEVEWNGIVTAATILARDQRRLICCKTFSRCVVFFSYCLFTIIVLSCLASPFSFADSMALFHHFIDRYYFPWSYF